MKFSSLTAKALLAAAIAVPTLPAVAAGNSAAAAQPAAEKAETAKICKKFDMTGSRTRARKLCLTAEQWKKFDVEDM